MHKIQEAERELDTIILGNAQAADADVDPLADTEVFRRTPSPPRPCPGASATHPSSDWMKLGGKPKDSSTSLPPQRDSWLTVGRRGKPAWRAPLSSTPTAGLRVYNRFSALEEENTEGPPPTASRLRRAPASQNKLFLDDKHFPALPRRPPPSSGASAFWAPSKCAPFCQSAAPVVAAARPGHARRRSHSPGLVPSGRRAPPSPSVLVLGSSMVRHVRVKNGYTHCHSGALVQDITDSAPRLLRDHPSAKAAVLQVGTNDLKRQESETLKEDFILLIDTVRSTERLCVVSGPIPAPRFGDVKFSRIRQLHVWLKGYCAAKNIPYVDNFTTFFRRPGLFKHDRLHPNSAGSSLLSLNIELTLEATELHV